MIYHIIKEDKWNEVKTEKLYAPNSLTREGFIHCSYENQLLKVAETLYRGQNDLLILCINDKKISNIIKSEDLFNLKENYPHIYGSVPINVIEKVIKLELSDNNGFKKPDLNILTSFLVEQGEWT